MRKRPATLTSALLARKGEAEPSRLTDGTVPKDVIALQEELVARVAADVSRSSARIVSAEAQQPAPEASAPEASVPEAPAAEPPAAETPAAEAVLPAANETELAEALGSAPMELPPGSADEPDYNPAEDAAAQQDSQVTLADWTARAQSGDTPFAYERMSDAEEPDRTGFIPLALGVTVVAVIATLVIWEFSDRGQLSPSSPQTVETAATDAVPPAIAPEPQSAAPAAETPPPAPVATAPAKAPAPASAKPAPTKPPAAPAPAVTGGYAVQLVSTVSQDSAEAAWAKISGKVSKLGFHEHEIERADLGAKGVRYRVQLTGFSTHDAGQKACATLKANKLSCLVLRQ